MNGRVGPADRRRVSRDAPGTCQRAARDAPRWHIHRSLVLSQRGVRQCVQRLTSRRRAGFRSDAPSSRVVRDCGIEISVAAASTPRSLVRAAAWVFVGPFLAIGGLALVAFGCGVLAVVVQLLATLLKHAGL